MLETPRLLLRPFTEADYPDYQGLIGDPDVAATTSDGVLPEAVIRAEFERFLGDHQQRGYSQWGAYLKDGGDFVGRAGFDHRDYEQFNEGGEPCTELRYAFMGAHWGKGYATEAGEALLKWGGDALGYSLCIAGCADRSPSAKRVLEKLGFTPHQVVIFRGQEVLYHTRDWRPH